MASTSSSEMDFFSFEAEPEDIYSADKEVSDGLFEGGTGDRDPQSVPKDQKHFYEIQQPHSIQRARGKTVQLRKFGADSKKE